MAATAPRPDDPRPLDDREQRLLAEIDDGLARAYPALGPDFGTDLDRQVPPRYRIADRAVAVLAVIVILAFVLPSGWFAVLVLFAAMTAPLLLIPAAQRAARDRDVDGS